MPHDHHEGIQEKGAEAEASNNPAHITTKVGSETILHRESTAYDNKVGGNHVKPQGPRRLQDEEDTLYKKEPDIPAEAVIILATTRVPRPTTGATGPTDRATNLEIQKVAAHKLSSKPPQRLSGRR